MIKDIIKSISSTLSSITSGLYYSKGNKVELVGTMNGQHVIITAQLHQYIPYKNFGEPGYYYKTSRKRKIRNPSGGFKTIEENIIRYRMSDADKKFIHSSYVNSHLTQEQISMLSGIPQPYVYRYIKHMKLTPKYQKIPRSKRKFIIKFNEGQIEFVDMDDINLDIGVLDNEELDPEKDFDIDPFPTASEWKARREEYGLKNGENWRNSSVNRNPGAREHGDGTKSKNKKANKQKRRQNRRNRIKGGI